MTSLLQIHDTAYLKLGVTVSLSALSTCQSPEGISCAWLEDPGAEVVKVHVAQSVTEEARYNRVKPG